MNPFITAKVGERWPSYFLTTGSTLLDYALSGGCKGIGTGRVVQLYGDEATGKSLMGVEIMADAQRQGGIGIFLDAESTLDLGRARDICRLDLSEDKLRMGCPYTIDELFDTYIAGALKVEAKGPVVVVIDTLSTLPTAAELDKEVADTIKYSRRALLVNACFRKYMPRIAERQLTVIFVGQTREDPTAGQYQEKRVTDGGRGLGFYSTHRILLKSKGKLYHGDDKKYPIGIKVEATVMKTKLADPFKRVDYHLYFEYGIDDIRSMAQFIKEVMGSTVYGINSTKRCRSMGDFLKWVESQENRTSIVEGLKNEVWKCWNLRFPKLGRVPKYGG